MTRMQHREFISAPIRRPAPLYRAPLTFNSVALSIHLSDFFANQMSSPARVRSGMLFGYSENNVLYALLASTAGFSNWYEPGTRVALDIDPRFAIGWSEALLEIFGTQLDWIGNWVVHPDSQLKSIRRDVRRFRPAFKSGLITDRSVLVVVGYSDGVLQTRTYTQVFEQGPTVIDSVISEVAAQGKVWGRRK